MLATLRAVWPAGCRRSALSVLCAVGALSVTALGCASLQTTAHLDRTEEVVVQTEQAFEARTQASLDLTAEVDRDAVTALAVARNPGLRALARKARAMLHAARAEGSLPSPELELEARNLPLARPYALGDAEMYMAAFRQRFPPAGAKDAQARAMAEQARAMLAELSTMERMVAERAAESFADYARAGEERRLLEAQLALLERMREATRARYSTGGTGLTEAARIEIEYAKMQRALARIDGMAARARASLNTLLRRPATEPLGKPRATVPESIALPLKELLARAEARRGALVQADARLRAAAARREAAVAEALVPEFMVGVAYMQSPMMRPGFGLTAGMSLPWLWGPGRHRIAQAQEEEAAEAVAREAAQLDSQGEISELHARLAAMERELVVLHRDSLPAARRSLEALNTAVSTGRANLLEWVQLAGLVLDLEMEAATLQGQLAATNAALERAVGVALPRTRIDFDKKP